MTNSSTHQKPESTPKERLSMHENVPAWYDCCTCEAEPHWLEVANELGIDICGHYEKIQATDCEGKEA